MAAHFFFTTFGSYGDIHPYIAVALGLQARGHRVTIGSSEQYRSKIETEGLAFRPLRPEFPFLMSKPEEMGDMMEKAFHPSKGTEYIIRTLVMPHIRETYEDTLREARDADFLVSHFIAFATPSAAEKLGKPWVSVFLQPSPLLSTYDPTIVSGAEWLTRPLNLLGPRGWKVFYQLGQKVMRPWGEPLDRIRAEAGLSPQRDVIFTSMRSPYGIQAWFSRVLARPQPDWPPRTAITGFPFYDKQEGGQNTARGGLDPALAAFLASGPPPVVFTLGSSAVFTPGEFYRESLRAALELGCRAVLLIGPDPRNRPPGAQPPSIHVAEYAPYSQLFPRAALNVHQGGIGTTGQALASGRPMLVVPYSHDQPDNANRVARLGVSRTIARHHYRASLLVRQLRHLLQNPAYAKRATEVAAEMGTEDGVKNACDGLEAMIGDARMKNPDLLERR